MNKTSKTKFFIPALLIFWAWWIFQVRTPVSQINPDQNATPTPMAKIKQSLTTTSSSLQKTPRTISDESSLVHMLFTEEEVKSIRSKIKLNLSVAYTAEASFFADFKRYTTDLKFSGVSLDDRPMKFKMGFVDPYYPHEDVQNENPLLMDSDALTDIRTAESPELIYAPNVKKIELDQLEKFCNRGCSASETEFEVIVATNLDDDPTLDVWLINEKKEIIHKIDDLKE